MCVQLLDWYDVTRKDLQGVEGGEGLLSQHTSFEAAIRACYPEFPWQSHFFLDNKKPRGHWKDPEHRRDLVESIGRQLGIVKVRDEE